MNTTITPSADQKHMEAGRRYNDLYDNTIYVDAVGTPFDNPEVVKRANRLIDAALALCGSPYYRVDQSIKWTAQEMAFLNLFAPENQETVTPDNTQALYELQNNLNYVLFCTIFGDLQGEHLWKRFMTFDQNLLRLWATLSTGYRENLLAYVNKRETFDDRMFALVKQRETESGYYG